MQAKTIQCRNNLRQIGTAMMLYAASNDGRLPATRRPAGTWMWDMSVDVSKQLINNGAVKQIFFCPFELDRQEFDGYAGLWTYSPDYRVTGYFYMYKRPVSSLPALVLPKFYKARMTDSVSNNEDNELASDVTLSVGSNFTSIMGGYNLPHGTSHLDSNNNPIGGNVLFMDGHCEWRPFNDMKIRTGTFNPQHWF